MSTAISSEREAIVRTLRDFCEAEIRPNVMKWDEAQEFPREVFRKLGELGVLGVLLPEKLGGAGLSYMDYQAIIEEISCVDPSVALSLAAHNSLGSNHIYQFGTEAQPPENGLPRGVSPSPRPARIRAGPGRPPSATGTNGS